MFNLNIHNFRSFQNQDFKFSRINILIGENSGGKSSLLKFLLVLKQTLDSPTEGNLKLKGDYTDLGNFEEAIYKRKNRSKLKFAFANAEKYHKYFLSEYEEYEYDLNNKHKKQILKFVKNVENSTTSIAFDLTSKLNNHHAIKTTISNNKIGYLEIIQRKRNEDDNARELICDLKIKLNEQEEFVFENCLGFKHGFFTMIGIELKDRFIKKYGDKFIPYYYSAFYLLLFQNFTIKNIELIRFVNPIGSSPKRFYFKEDKKASYKNIDIEKFINIMGDPAFSKKDYNERITDLNKVIKEFGIADEISLVTDQQLPVVALNVKTKEFWSNITDVGYGVSLQIPILFQAVLSEKYTKDGQTLLIEQPEVHLHPTLQSNFIKTLINLGSKNRYFIETHSEHIIRKLQVMVKSDEFKLKPEDVTIHYFKRTPEKFEITNHYIQTNGRMEPKFPDGFFDASYNLIKELL
tara:strand:+ start:11169 stop:12557 length:1389 start_codon:yes stop_codon:yes gene_type:complete